MCSWCWGFKPLWQRLQKKLPDSIRTEYVVGGLAPDTDAPMPDQMREMLQQTWQRIAHTIPGTEFNHDFWTNNTPRRATYPACRAVLAAKAQDEAFEELMISAIQQAYYLDAKNPSDDDVLVALANDVGCDVNAFKHSLNSPSTFESLQNQLLLTRHLGASGFPSLFLEVVDKSAINIALSYSDIEPMFDQIDTAIAV